MTATLFTEVVQACGGVDWAEALSALGLIALFLVLFVPSILGKDKNDSN